jgi:hypothetical protein
MTDKYVLDENRNAVPCADLMVWAKAFETADRRVARDEVGPYSVSTVFLGIDHSFGEGPPLIFETMVFGPPDGGEVDMDRCSTWAEAEAMHAGFVEKYRTAGRA